MQRTFVIGDIHGCIKTFAALLDDLIKINKCDKIYLLGDYIDRGPDSKAVVDLIIDLIDKGYNIYPLRGNHEQFLVDSIHSPLSHHSWMRNGAAETLLSFGIDNAREFSAKYIDFFTSLRYYYKLKNFILTHAGLNFSSNNPFYDKESMLWIRNKEVDLKKIDNRRLIVGHTPTDINEIKNSLNNNLIRLDAGCVYYDLYPNMGNLAALELNTMELFYLENRE